MMSASKTDGLHRLMRALPLSVDATLRRYGHRIQMPRKHQSGVIVANRGQFPGAVTDCYFFFVKGRGLSLWMANS